MAQIDYKYADGWIICYDHSIEDLDTGETIDYYVVRQVRGKITSDITVYPTKEIAQKIAENYSNNPIVEVA